MSGQRFAQCKGCGHRCVPPVRPGLVQRSLCRACERRTTEADVDDFHVFRAGGIGSSDAPVIMKKSPWRTRFELWATRTKRIRPQPQNSAMRRGLQFEPLARAVYQRMTGIPMPAGRGINRRNPVIRANFDGTNADLRRKLEIKCPGVDDHQFTALYKRIPEKYEWQCRHLLAVEEDPDLDYFSFACQGLEPLMNKLGWEALFARLSDDEIRKRSVLLHMKRDEKKERRMLTEELYFWECIQTDTPPSDELVSDERAARAPKPSLAREVFSVRRSR